MRERVGEEAYREGLAALEAAAAMVEETRELMAGLPVPSAEEAALLGEHRERIQPRPRRGRARVIDSHCHIDVPTSTATATRSWRGRGRRVSRRC